MANNSALPAIFYFPFEGISGGRYFMGGCCAILSLCPSEWMGDREPPFSSFIVILSIFGGVHKDFNNCTAA
jgi:hypothetical protein